MFLDDSIVQACLLPEYLQFIRRKTLQDRQRAVFTQQPVVQDDVPKSRIEKISHWVAVQVDHEYPTSGDPAHFAENVDRSIVVKVVQRQRRDHVINRSVRKRKLESTAPHRRDFGKR